MGDETSNSVFADIFDNYTQARNLQKKTADEHAEAAVARTSRATQLLEEAVVKVDDLLGSSPDSAKLIGMKCALLYEQAKVLTSAGQELEARKVLSGALELAQPFATKPEVIYVMLRIVNHLSYLFAEDGELDKPLAMLEQMAGFYAQFKERDPPSEVFTGDDLFQQATPAEGSLEKLERLVTNNFQMLSFVHKKQGDVDGFIRCHHLVLRRQLELHDTEPPLWASKVALLAGYFLDRDQLDEARHHLTAASVVLNSYEASLEDDADPVVVSARWQEFAKVSADLAKGWVKYSLSLFAASRDWARAQESENPLFQMFSPQASALAAIPEEEAAVPTSDACLEQDAAGKKPEGGEPTVDETKTMGEDQSLLEGEKPSVEFLGDGKDQGVKSLEIEDSLKFSNLQTAAFERGVPSTRVETPDQARALFRFAHLWLRHSAGYYNLRDYPNEYVDVIIELCELLRNLAFFERDPGCQYDVQRRRADTVERLCELVRELRPQCYVTVGVELLWELTEAQIELLGLELRGLFNDVDNGCGDFAQLVDGVAPGAAPPATPDGRRFGSDPVSTGAADLRQPEYFADLAPTSDDSKHFFHLGDVTDPSSAAYEVTPDAANVEDLHETTAVSEVQLDELARLENAPDVCPLVRKPGAVSAVTDEVQCKYSAMPTSDATSQEATKPEECVNTAASTCALKAQE